MARAQEAAIVAAALPADHPAQDVLARMIAGDADGRALHKWRFDSLGIDALYGLVCLESVGLNGHAERIDAAYRGWDNWLARQADRRRQESAL